MLIQSKFNYESIFIKKHNNVSNVMFSYHQVDWKRSFFYTFYHMIENDIVQVVLKRKTIKRFQYELIIYHYLPLANLVKIYWNSLPSDLIFQKWNRNCFIFIFISSKWMIQMKVQRHEVESMPCFAKVTGFRHTDHTQY